MNDQNITLKEVLELVEVERDAEGRLFVTCVRGNVWGNVWGDVWGDVEQHNRG